ncbi:GntR family transcriptional regulator [Microbacterium sp. MYb62]|uniref:GntR family transcriptional regulator n=1 Tax=Microbacterium sp. MYb62 TaxID=1848690 RepID=UPI000CFE328E|nr:GntR family transcriptional regulator [Microbacterium sp. MYb62]PRB18608.1 GntR family transcriptional regulator [Microbacterium sp. MYb62]
MSGKHGEAAMRIAAELRRSILAGEYEPGDRVRQEELAERLGASRVPVREALRTLSAEGLVTLVANTGAWVSELTAAECDELYRMRERVEPLLLEYNVPLLTAGDLDRLADLAQRMRTVGDVEEFLRLDWEFHSLTYSRATTSVLDATVQQLWNRTQHYRRAFVRLSDPRDDRSIHLEHELLVEALRRLDAEEAGSVLRIHVRRTRLELGQRPEVFTKNGRGGAA